MKAARAAARLALVGLALAACLPPHLSRLALRRPSPWPRRFLRLSARAIGLDLRQSGQPLDGHALIVANHRSWMDIVVIAAASGCSFVSKAEVAGWPVIGRLARMHRTVFVERARRSGTRDQADALRAALADGQAVALFPEGGTHDGAGILPFKPSLFASVMPAPAGVRVQPALIDYGQHSAEVGWPDGEGMMANALRLLSRRGRIAVTVAFRPPLDPAAFPDRKALAAASRAALEEPAVFG